MKFSVKCLLLGLAFTATNAQTIGVVQQNATNIEPKTEAPKTNVITGAPVSVSNSPPVTNKVITGAPVSVPTVINTVITGAPVTLLTSAPVPAQNTKITGAPVQVVTAAPVNPPTIAPVKSPTAAPVSPPTAAPVNPPTATPVDPPTAAPIKPPTSAPTNRPTRRPTPAPTAKPTAPPGPTSRPTGAPTESPAPSPSPSAVPTVPPTLSQAPTDRPTGEPTESPAPSPSPSAFPTNLPTTRPSVAPSGNPTLTFKPSSTPSMSQVPSSSPSASPTSTPSKHPTASPSSLPTGTPSKLPTRAPSAEPTVFPTRTPSVEPTSSPTEEAFKTKYSKVKLILMDIDHEMNGDQIEQFEISTLQFVNDTAPHTDGYEIDILAVTVTAQNVIHPEAPVANNETNQGERRMQTNAALEVTFKAVGLVTEGRAPYDFDFKTDIVAVGFENHMNLYYYILSNADPFFLPLKAHTDIEDPVVEEEKGKFIAAVVFSVIAFLVALFASIYAIRRHLRVKRKRRQRQSRSSLSQKSNTYSENSTDDSDEENPFQPPLQLSISPGKMDLENVPITPQALASPFKRDYRDVAAMPNSPDSVKEEEPTVFGETSAAIRKWLTPRVASPKDNECKEDGKPPKPTSSPDPMALKARTTDATGTFTTGGNSTKNALGKPNSMFGQSTLTIPMSFFGGQNSDGESESETPMGSLAESAASSFFNRVGKSVFTGRPSSLGAPAAGRPSSESFLRARDRFSPRDGSFDEDEQKKNDTIFGARARANHTAPPSAEKKSLLNEEIMRKHRASYQPSEVSDVSLNEFKGGDKYNTVQAPSSVATSRASQFSSSTLGARARQSIGDDSSLNALRSKPESYDVFAPSGPIGIVVDTSKNGPAVHSLKSTSPMLGLINPGDLIIALDDEDTRKMTAASLTRLMAKKSRQKERKITLLSLDGF